MRILSYILALLLAAHALACVGYDGARVVQEVTMLAVPAVEAGTRPDNSLIYAPRRADAFGDHDQNSSTPDLSARRRLERGYVWAIDPHGYIDECHAQLAYTQAHPPTPTSQIPSGDGAGNDLSPTVLYCLNSANKTVAALTDYKGDVVAQYGFTPYGEVRSVDLYTPPNDGSTAGIQASYDAYAAAEMNCLGHQGLRFERYDRPWLPPMALTQLPDSSLGGFAGLYHNRNRPYEPRHGRFNSRDPNALGQLVQSATARGGEAMTVRVAFPAITAHYGDGLNTHAAYLASPLMHQDPEGLEFSYGGLGAAMGIQGVVGSLISGYMSGWDLNRMLIGGAAGALGGAAGYGVSLAFAASASGLFAAVGQGAAIGSASGGVQGFTDTLLRTNVDWQLAIQDGLWSALTGGVTGGIAGRITFRPGGTVAPTVSVVSSSASRNFASAARGIEDGVLGGYILRDGTVGFVRFSANAIERHSDAVAAGLIPDTAIGGFSVFVRNSQPTVINFQSFLNLEVNNFTLSPSLQNAIRSALGL